MGLFLSAAGTGGGLKVQATEAGNRPVSFRFINMDKKSFDHSAELRANLIMQMAWDVGGSQTGLQLGKNETLFFLSVLLSVLLEFPFLKASVHAGFKAELKSCSRTNEIDVLAQPCKAGPFRFWQFASTRHGTSRPCRYCRRRSRLHASRR